jgi:hypothetical protein
MSRPNTTVCPGGKMDLAMQLIFMRCTRRKPLPSTGQPRRWHGYMLLALYLAYWTVSFGIFGGAPDRDGLTERYASTSVSRRSPASAFGSP